jgi:hypothetical protein
MKMILLAALSAGLLSPGMASSQGPAPSIRQPSARNTLNEQPTAIGERIDRRLARGRLSPEAAAQAHREIDDIQAQLADERLRDGGQLSEADRFAAEGRIRGLEDQIEGERTPLVAPKP